jgi:hypothetical protein
VQELNTFLLKEINAMLKTFINQLIFQYLIVPSRILALTDWKQILVPNKIIPLFQSHAEISASTANLADIDASDE